MHEIQWYTTVGCVCVRLRLHDLQTMAELLEDPVKKINTPCDR